MTGMVRRFEGAVNAANAWHRFRKGQTANLVKAFAAAKMI
jgi:hypothetical protein